jgi:hypothetical protein
MADENNKDQEQPKRPMTVEEAGRRGGGEVASERGPSSSAASARRAGHGRQKAGPRVLRGDRPQGRPARQGRARRGVLLDHRPQGGQKVKELIEQAKKNQ